jgi:lipopolysaccharide/colanic/teichoic acid biosynthesis glycosyltransferase
MITASVVLVLFLLIAALVISFIEPKSRGEVIYSPFEARHYTPPNAVTKCRHNRCRRNSRQRPYNGGWRNR